MDSDTLLACQNELICYMCMKCFIDPITIDCGHSFCRPCLCLCQEDTEAPICCPKCRETSKKSDFKTNIVLKKLAVLARKTRLCHEQSSEAQICGIHKQKKELFWEADKNLLCGLCPESPEYVGHSHRPEEWAAEEYRGHDACKAIWNLQRER